MSKKEKRIAPSVKDITGPQGPPPKKKPVHPSPEEIENEVRKYVKREGGYRKGLSEKDKKKCEALCKKYNHPVAWTNSLPM